jgi:hypothetical protein
MTIDLKRILLWLVVIFVIVSAWHDPYRSASSIGTFLGSLAHFLGLVVYAFALFVGGLVHGGVH